MKAKLMCKTQNMDQKLSSWIIQGKSMLNRFVLFLSVFLSLVTASMAQDAYDLKDEEAFKVNNPDAKELSGMSIVGNDEAPKSLYIVPWKSSEIGAETSMRAVLNESDTPVDRDVLKRQLEFYLISTADAKR